MSNLNPQQFLPGMENIPTREVPVSTPGPKTSGQWSGQIPGQLAMGVTHGEHGIPTSHGDFTPHDPYEVDRHGNVYEPTHKVKMPSADKDAGNSSVKELYSSHGGGHDRDEKVNSFWRSQPLVQVRSDTPVHTAQAVTTTEFKQVPGKAPGRARIDKIRSSLRAGEPIREPVRLVRQSGRLYALDGHHRMVAAREEGLEHYPAHLWDRDKRD